MANTPGVRFVESVATPSIAGVGSVIAAFLGTSARGRTDKPLLVSSFEEASQLYGDIGDEVTNLSMAAYDFFQGGGGQCYLLRIVGNGALGSSNTVDIVERDSVGVALSAYANSEGVWGDDLGIDFERHQVTIVGSPVATDSDGDALPAGTARISLNSILDISIGDIFDVFNPATGLVYTTSESPVTVLAIDASNSDIFVDDPGNLVAGAAASSILKTSSQHIAFGKCSAQIGAADLTASVANPDGFSKNSFVSFTIFAHYSEITAAASEVYEQHDQLITKVSGSTLSFGAAPGTTLPLSTSAGLAYPVALAADGIDFDAAVAGEAGNGVSVEFTINSGNPNVATVSGNKVTIALIDNLQTTAQAVTALTAAGSTITDLVTVTQIGAGALVVAAAFAETFLDGGAELRAISQEFFMEISVGGVTAEVFENLSHGPLHPRYYGSLLGGTVATLTPSRKNQSAFLILDDAGNTPSINTMPLTRSVALAGGADGAIPGDVQMVGSSGGTKSGIFLYDGIPLVRIIAGPGYTTTSFQQALVTFCETQQGIEAYLDTPQAAVTHDALALHRQTTLGVQSTYGQLFGPWIVVSDPSGARDDTREEPLSARLAGLSSRVMDAGQHLSIGNQVIPGALDIIARFSQSEYASLGAQQVNLITDRLGSGTRVGDDYTLQSVSSDPRKFGSVRRWLGYFKVSVETALADIVFSPANVQLFEDIEGAISNFMLQEYNKGALFGSTPTNAFQVIIGSQTTSETDLANGIVRATVKMSPVTPAREIVLNLQISAGGISGI